MGRKNTRVRMVFRVHVPQPGGQWLSLQVASQTIECCTHCNFSFQTHYSNHTFLCMFFKMVKYHIFNIKCMNALGCFTAQRSAHEHPAVERQDVDHCSVLGGLQMILRGQNFTSESKVIFFEKTHGE